MAFCLSNDSIWSPCLTGMKFYFLRQMFRDLKKTRLKLNKCYFSYLKCSILKHKFIFFYSKNIKTYLQELFSLHAESKICITLLCTPFIYIAEHYLLTLTQGSPRRTSTLLTQRIQQWKYHYHKHQNYTKW